MARSTPADSCCSLFRDRAASSWCPGWTAVATARPYDEVDVPGSNVGYVSDHAECHRRSVERPSPVRLSGPRTQDRRGDGGGHSAYR